MTDFGVLPPEVNSAQMYAGAGAAPLLAAAAAWDGLAGELRSAGASYSAAISGLAASWRGPASAQMAAAAAPYVAWLHGTAARAEDTAGQAREAVAAYEAAFAATVPPPAIAANRTRRAALVAANALGQNSAAIAAADAQYAGMWSQDAAAMYGYAGQSAKATELTPFDSAPQTTNPAGAASQAGAAGPAAAGSAATNTQSVLAQLTSATPAALHSLTTPAATTAPSSPFAGLSGIDDFVTGPFSPGELFVIPSTPEFLGVDTTGLSLEGGPPSAADVIRSVRPSEISVSVGRASQVGGLALPHGWSSAAPAIRSAAVALTDISGPPAAAVAPQGSPVSGVAAVASVARSQGSLLGTTAASVAASVAASGSAAAGVSAARSVGMGVTAVGGTATSANVFFLVPEASEAVDAAQAGGGVQ